MRHGHLTLPLGHSLRTTPPYGPLGHLLGNVLLTVPRPPRFPTAPLWHGPPTVPRFPTARLPPQRKRRPAVGARGGVGRPRHNGSGARPRPNGREKPRPNRLVTKLHPNEKEGHPQ